jgi:hypothetical protein
MSTAAGLPVSIWQVQAFASGTHIVTDGGAGPWLYVLCTNPEDLDDNRERFRMCEDLADFLNGGLRPAWLDEMERVREYELIGVDGSCVTATGPMYDADPPNLNWHERQDDESRDARARLIDRLWLGRGRNGPTAKAD